LTPWLHLMLDRPLMARRLREETQGQDRAVRELQVMERSYRGPMKVLSGGG